jgi:lysophospholipase L1-like esterase
VPPDAVLLRFSGRFKVTKPRIVLLGDSITVGCRETGVTADTTYPSCLQTLLDRAGLDVELIVSALHGVYMGYAVRRFERMAGRYQPDYVLIMLGANDAVPAGGNSSTQPEDFEAALETLVTLCRRANATAIIASPPPRSDTRSRQLLRRYAETARSIAAKAELPFIDLFTRLSEERFLSGLLPDCQHPNPAANRIIATTVLECLLQVPGIRGSVSSTDLDPADGWINERGTLSLDGACSQGHPKGTP